MATQCSSSRSHPTQDISCFADCHQMLRLLSLRIRFPFLPSFSIFHRFDPCVVVVYFVVSSVFLWLEEVDDFVFPSLFGSFHWSVCLVFDAEAGVPFCRFLRPSFVWQRCYSHCQTPFHSSVCSNPAWDFGCFHLFYGCTSASFHEFHSSSSVSAVSITSSVSFMKETSLPWSQSVFELLPSAVSSSELLWFSFSPSSSFSFLLV